MTMKPALTPDEWWDRYGASDGAEVMRELWAKRKVVFLEKPSPTYTGIEFRDGKLWGYGSDGTGITLDLSVRLATAALCLDGHPAGFTREDVEALRREVGDGLSTEPRPIPGKEHVWGIAARIEALLPPEAS